MKIKYLWNQSGQNYRLFTESDVEIGHFYPADLLNFDTLGWEEITEAP